MSEIKGAQRCADFHSRVPDFRRCTPSVVGVQWNKAYFNTESYGKRQGLEIVEYMGVSRASKRQKLSFVIGRIDQSLLWVAVGPYSLGAAVMVSLPSFSQKHERLRKSDQIYCFLHIQMSSWSIYKAIILRWDSPDRVLGRIDIKYGHGNKRPRTYRTTVNTLKWRQRWRGRPVGMSQF